MTEETRSLKSVLVDKKFSSIQKDVSKKTTPKLSGKVKHYISNKNIFIQAWQGHRVNYRDGKKCRFNRLRRFAEEALVGATEEICHNPCHTDLLFLFLCSYLLVCIELKIKQYRSLPFLGQDWFDSTQVIIVQNVIRFF